MNILIITANPKDTNHTQTIAETYTKNAEACGHTIHFIDVYKEEWRLSYATGMKPLEGSSDEATIKRAQEMIQASDEIVIIHPVWWSNMPAGLKNFIDSVFAPRFAYKYNEDGGTEKLLLGKKAKIFCTAGSVAPYYNIPIVRDFTPLFVLWREALLWFCGVTVIDIKICDRMNINKGVAPEGHFEKFLRRVEYSARCVH